MGPLKKRKNLWLSLALLGLSFPLHAIASMNCTVIHPHPPTEADKALLAADYANAETLYRGALAATPGNVESTVGLVHALLHEQKVDEALAAVQESLKLKSTSPDLLTLRGEVELRAGEPWTAAKSAQQAMNLDPCNPRTRLLFSRLSELSSNYASEERNLQAAHQLSPDDPEIFLEWVTTLPRSKRIPALEAFLAKPNGTSGEDRRHLKNYLAHLRKLVSTQQKACRLVSKTNATEIPLAFIMHDVRRIESFGLNVQLNNSNSRLVLDTGAGGLLLTSAAAKRAGLHPFSQNEIGGIGDEGNVKGYTAFVDSIRLGDLEFQNCLVDVVDGKAMPGGGDGLIGMDVLSHFLVTINYPDRKLQLGPLPPRPGEAPQNYELGSESSSESEATSAAKSEAAESPAGKTSETKPARQRLHDRYIAPEMESYTRVYRSGHNLILPVTLNQSTKKLFILDTGAFNTLISPKAAREVTKLDKDSTRTIVGLSGEVEDVFTAREVTFQFAQLTQKVYDAVAFNTAKISKHNGMEISGFLGANTLLQLKIHIDYRDGLVKFDYDPKHHSPL